VEAQPLPAGAEDAEARVVPFSNLEKVFWPKEGYTKGDLIAYYRAISPWILPYLRDRPLVMTRYPDGIEGKSFFQKDAPGFSPPWLRTLRVWSEDTRRDIDFFVCDNVESLLYVAILGSIPLHVWSSRVGALGKPDWCILDLDPKGAPFTDVVELARAVHALCESIGLPSYAKTSGQAGLHVLIPLGGQLTHVQSRSLGELIAKVIEAKHRTIATTERVVSARSGRVYLDYLQNGHGKTIAAPFSARPVPGATVSTPLSWREVTKKLDPKKLTLRSVPKRMEKLGADPLAPVIAEKPDLRAALEALGEKVGA
jgi:bifunctional non-homologous end joining protein LigD